MNDTPAHIQDLQLAIWLAKPPAERLLQFLIDNEALLKGLDEAKKALEKKYAQEQSSQDKDQ